MEEASSAEVLLVHCQSMALQVFCGAVPRVTLGAEIVDEILDFFVVLCFYSLFALGLGDAVLRQHVYLVERNNYNSFHFGRTAYPSANNFRAKG